MADTPGIVKFPTALDSPDSLIRVGNGLVTTLAADITAGQTSFVVTNAAGWPATGIATIQKRTAATIGAETVYLPTGPLEIITFELSGNTLSNVLRGRQGTAAIAHQAGDYIECRITALHHQALRDAILNLEGQVFGWQKFIFGETPTGAVNGSNAAFQSLFDFVPESVVVLVNGVEQRRVTDFNTSGTRNITLTEAPLTGESVRINYIIP